MRPKAICILPTLELAAEYTRADREEVIVAHTVDTQRAKLQALQQASLAWWESRRPIGWELRQHLDKPAVNTTTSQEQHLAEAVASAVECGAI